MAKSAIRDIYANKFYGAATESGANTLTFSEINTNVNIFDKVAWILNRLEWYLSVATLALLQASTDTISCALSASDTIPNLSLSNPSVIDVVTIQLIAPAEVGGQAPFPTPIIRDFSSMPGGGLIIAPRPLYVAVEGVSLATAATAEVRGYFQAKSLAADEYLELIDFYRIVS